METAKVYDYILSIVDSSYVSWFGSMGNVLQDGYCVLILNGNGTLVLNNKYLIHVPQSFIQIYSTGLPQECSKVAYYVFLIILLRQQSIWFSDLSSRQE